MPLLNLPRLEGLLGMTHNTFTPYAPAVPVLNAVRQWAQGVGQRSSPRGMLEALAGQVQDYQNMPAEQLATMFGPSGGSLGGLAAHTVWHGSPHLFDKFDISKIGTGEGAQAYGHGLYFAENPNYGKVEVILVVKAWHKD